MRIFNLLREKSGWLVVYASAFALINLAALSEAIPSGRWFAAAFYAAAVAASVAIAVKEALDWRHYGQLAKKADAHMRHLEALDRERSANGT